MLLVIAARLLIPLLIPAYPLPGIIAALVLDAVDQTLFQTFTHLPLDGYQSYDKALDIYYLSIAYISTLRNWTNHFAFQVGRFLFYYRLAGVALFELSGWRVLLFIFPNTFEYFFIWYETVVLWRNPRRLPRAAVVGAAATIWLIIKLPQEFWLHIARLDLTDVLKTALFGAPPETTWGVLFQALPGVFIGAVVASVALIGGLAWLLIPTAIFAVNDDADGPQVGAAMIGGFLLAMTLSWMPFLQARFATEQRLRSMFHLRTIRRLFKHAPLAWLLAIAVVYVLALPLYLLKVALLPQDAYWLITLIFIASIYPAKVVAGWAYHRAVQREAAGELSWWVWRWLARLGMVPLLGAFAFLLYFTQFIGAHGSAGLFEHHAFLLPWPGQPG